MEKLVDSVAQRCFGGTLPDCPELITLAVTVTAWPLQEASEEQTSRFFEDLLLHIRARLGAQNVPWLQ
jgi:hypothetical protein